MRHLVAGLLGLTAAACMPPVPLPLSAPPPDVSTDAAPDVLAPRDGAGVIFVARTKTLKDMGCIYDVQLDGRNVAALRRGEQVTLYADPGVRIVGVSIRNTKSSCEPADAHVPVEVVAHATTELRVTATIEYDLKIEATTR